MQIVSGGETISFLGEKLLSGKSCFFGKKKENQNYAEGGVAPAGAKVTGRGY